MKFKLHIIKKCNASDIGWSVKKLKFIYAGYLTRSNNNKWNRRVKVRYPKDKVKGSGRPPTRWRDEIASKFRILWQKTAMVGGLEAGCNGVTTPTAEREFQVKEIVRINYI